jgi:DNA modification methylase
MAPLTTILDRPCADTESSFPVADRPATVTAGCGDKGQSTSNPRVRAGGVMSKTGNSASAPVNALHFGDNLDVLEKMPAESVDLIYLDPPFNSKADYGVIYGTKRGASQAQSHAFKDMWSWGPDARDALNLAAKRHLEAGALLDSFQKVFPESNMLAYLAMMGVRLIEMQRVLKPTGSLYLHCDPTASHYLKVLLDSIFGVTNFRSEVIWKRTSSHNSAKRWGPIHDTILFVSKSDDYTWNRVFLPYDEKYVKRYYKYVDAAGRRYRLSDLTGSGKRNGESGKEWGGFDPTTYSRHPSRRVPKLQIVTVDQMFEKHPIELPGTLDPPEIIRLVPREPTPKKRKKAIEGQAEMLFALENPQEKYKPDKRGKRQIRPVDIEVIRADSTKRKTK